MGLRSRGLYEQRVSERGRAWTRTFAPPPFLPCSANPTFEFYDIVLRFLIRYSTTIEDPLLHTIRPALRYLSLLGILFDSISTHSTPFDSTSLHSITLLSLE
ncbi:hypothetical protein FS749_011532 [Ceratobasidium sp. UAMH 11750]|nr:hypothetical protein FS749_011532 [Ceratobasidium sp. UAMH 11750]